MSSEKKMENFIDLDKALTGELRKQSAHLGVYRRRTVVLSPVGIQVYQLDEAEKALTIVPITADTIVTDIKTGTVRGSHGASHPNQSLFRVIPNETLSTTSSSYRPRIFGSSTEEHWFSASTLETAQLWKTAIEERARVLAKARASGTGVTSTMADEEATAAKTSSAPQKVTPGTSVSSKSLTREPSKRLVMTESMIMSRDEKRKNLREHLKRSASVHIRSLPVPLHKTINLIQQASWREVLVTNGLRIMAEVALAKDNPCLRVSCVIPASPERAFDMYYNFDRRSQWDNMTESVEVLHAEEDGHSRTLHYKMRPQKVDGFWTAPRDFVVDSSWRKDDDGSIVIIETSNKERNVAVPSGYVRGELFALGITLCPRRRKPRVPGPSPLAGDSLRPETADDDESDSRTPESEDCLLQMAVHACVGGWLAKMPLEWGQKWLYHFMLRIVGFRQVLEEDNYQSVDFEQWTSPSATNASSMVPGTSLQSFQGGSVDNILPTSTSPVSKAEPMHGDAVPGGDNPVPKEPPKLPPVEGTLSKDNVYNITDPFNLRSRTYLEDRKKQPSEGTMFDLIAMDLWEVDAPVENVAVNLKGGLADTYLKSPGPKPYLFIIQFQVPGPPCLSFVAYFAARPGAIENISPFSRLFADFIEGTDSFRDSRFKFIPRVVKGSYVVKSAVGQTPALLGNKLVCTYHKGDGYFEIDVDVASSNVAGGILRVVKGYITALTIDMCFLLEAQHEEELPEAVLGSLRFEKLSLDMAKKWVPPPQ